jgi:hypothetical protein
MGSRSKQAGRASLRKGRKERGEDEMSDSGGRTRIEVDGSKSDGLRVDFWKSKQPRENTIWRIKNRRFEAGMPEEVRNITIRNFC